MFHSARSNVDARRIADAIASAPDLVGACDRLVSELSEALGTRSCVFRRGARGWWLVSQHRGGMDVPLGDLLEVLNAVPDDRDVALITLDANGNNAWTSMALGVLDEPVIVLLAGDWTQAGVLSGLAVTLSFALRSVREHHLRRRAEQSVVGRSLSRGAGIEDACQRIVHHIARAMQVERVTLALHEPDDDRLTIAATSRPFDSPAPAARIEPGAWVMGHVYTTRRSVLVRDTRRMPELPKNGTAYRTFSFAAVPILSGGEAIGVLSATDKKNGSAFERQDIAVLRLLSASAALAIKAALSEAESHRLAHAATVDALTGLFNRPYLDARLHQEFERARRGSSSLTLLLADIDDFKTVNDTYGHQIGDAVLQAVAGVLRSAVRVFDVCARYGGDEFAILMPSGDQTSVAASAERIRRCVSEFGGAEESDTPLPRVTMSVGVAVIEPGDAPPDLVKRADECLYLAKAEGKNRVRLSTPPQPQRVSFMTPSPRKPA
jgi:diguanylate cyclase (GGDEF)-like protein